PRHQGHDAAPARPPRLRGAHPAGGQHDGGDPRPRPGRGVLLQRARRPRRRGLRGGRAEGRPRRRGPVLRHLLRQPDLRPRARAEDVQAEVRAQGRQPARPGPGDRQGPHLGPQPRVRGGRAQGRPVRPPLRSRRGDPRQPQRRLCGGAEAAGAPGVQRPVPPGGGGGPARRVRSLRPFLRADGPADGRAEVMPRREDLKSVLVIGSGPIVIGQACEFDYSGTQACRVLKAEGLRVTLVNSNPATIMTDPEFADATYVEPITPEVVEKIIARERPDALLPTLGGQTALNTAIALYEDGVLEKYGVELIGADVEAIQAGENRERFKEIVAKVARERGLNAESARSRICHSMEECLDAARELGYPVVVRPSFTMGGAGSGFAHDEDDLRRIAGAGRPRGAAR